MKKLAFLSVIMIIVFVGCRKEKTIYRGQKLSGDGCNEKIYTYSGTPAPGNSGFARSQVDYGKVEIIVQPIQDQGNLDQLANDIVSQFTNPYERVYAIYYWIDENIDYDYPELDNILQGGGDCAHQNSEVVLQRKLAVCEGFSNIFCILCKNVGINSVKIHGKVTYDATTGHAWNAVEIENKWYVLDVTWDENKKKGTNFFLIDPIYFYNSHIPYSTYEKWKLF